MSSRQPADVTMHPAPSPSAAQQQQQQQQSSVPPAGAASVSSGGDVKQSAAGSSSSGGVASSPIPAGWPRELSTDCFPYLVKLLPDRRTVKYIAKGNHALDVGTVRASLPVPTDALVYYFEVRLIDLNNGVLRGGGTSNVAIGFATDALPLSRQVGSTTDSFSYQGEDGKKLNNGGATVARGANFGPPFGIDDTVGAGFNAYNQSIFFTRNGRLLGTAFTDLKGPKLFPTISLHAPGEAVYVNFGQDKFVFDIAGLRADEADKFNITIRSIEVDRASVMIPLVRNYFLVHGFEKALKALDAAVPPTTVVAAAAATSTSGDVDMVVAPQPSAKSASSNGGEQKSREEKSVAPGSESSDLSAGAEQQAQQQAVAYQTLTKRKAMRESIMAGDATSATQLISSLSPDLLNQRVDVAFGLNSLHFIGLLQRQQTDVALQFARQVLSRYKDPPQRDELRVRGGVFVRLDDDVLIARGVAQPLLSLLAYSDVSQAPATVAALLQPDYRRRVADLANTAVLESLHVPSESSIGSLLKHALGCDAILRHQTGGYGPPPVASVQP